MTRIPTLLSTLIIGSALTLTACGNKKPAATPADPAAAPAATDPAEPAPAGEEPKAEDKPMANDKPAGGGGW